jgi:MoxR-like ATPase
MTLTPIARERRTSVIEKIGALRENVERAIRGKTDVVDLALTSLVAKGHLLIEDVPGVGKTTLARALARSVGCTFHRIQFTSDLLPSDILGVNIFDPSRGRFEFKPGPIFANIVLADEINRTTPKTQSSLLEAMNEARVSLDHSTYPLPAPFMVLATQNPREYEGTYPLPESQLDRFLLRIRIGYPGAPDEKAILRGASVPPDNLGAVISDAEVRSLQEDVERVRAADSVLDYLMAVVTATRKSPLLSLGVSPRGSLALLRAAQAAALAEGRDYLVPDDVKGLAVAALAHRVIGRNGGGHGESPRLDAEAVIRALLHDVPVPR